MRQLTYILTVLSLLGCATKDNSRNNSNQSADNRNEKIFYEFASYSSLETLKISSKAIPVRWVDNLAGDYSFNDKWSYGENIFKNEDGQLICDGICPEQSNEMIDGKGRILKDSITAYYEIIDTTHQLHTIECEAWCYEFAGTDFINVVKKSKDSIFCYTPCNIGTNSSLKLDIIRNNCFARIELTSIRKELHSKVSNRRTYHCTDGYIKIDRKFWKQGIMKAEFSFIFDHKENPQQIMYWKGKIYSKVIVRINATGLLLEQEIAKLNCRSSGKKLISFMSYFLNLTKSSSFLYKT